MADTVGCLVIGCFFPIYIDASLWSNCVVYISVPFIHANYNFCQNSSEGNKSHFVTSFYKAVVSKLTLGHDLQFSLS